MALVMKDIMVEVGDTVGRSVDVLTVDQEGTYNWTTVDSMEGFLRMLKECRDRELEIRVISTEMGD